MYVCMYMCACLRERQLCQQVLSGGSQGSVVGTAEQLLFGRQGVVGGVGGHGLFVEVLNLIFIHLHNHRPLQLHGGAWERHAYKTGSS